MHARKHMRMRAEHSEMCTCIAASTTRVKRSCFRRRCNSLACQDPLPLAWEGSAKCASRASSWASWVDLTYWASCALYRRATMPDQTKAVCEGHLEWPHPGRQGEPGPAKAEHGPWDVSARCLHGAPLRSGWQHLRLRVPICGKVPGSHDCVVMYAAMSHEAECRGEAGAAWRWLAAKGAPITQIIGISLQPVSLSPTEA